MSFTLIASLSSHQPHFTCWFHISCGWWLSPRYRTTNTRPFGLAVFSTDVWARIQHLLQLVRRLFSTLWYVNNPRFQRCSRIFICLKHFLGTDYRADFKRLSPHASDSGPHPLRVKTPTSREEYNLYSWLVQTCQTGPSSLLKASPLNSPPREQDVGL